MYQQKKPFLQNAKRELPKLVKDRKAASLLAELYAIVGRMEFSERMDLDKVEKLLKGGAWNSRGFSTDFEEMIRKVHLANFLSVLECQLPPWIVSVYFCSTFSLPICLYLL